LQHREIKLIELVRRLLLDGRGKMHLDVGVIALGAGQPARHDVIGSAFALRGSDPFERFASAIELAKPKRGRCEIELAIEVFGFEPCDLRPPRDRFGPVLFFTGFRQNIKSGQRIAVKGQRLARRVRGPIIILPGQLLRGAFEGI